MIVLLVGLSMFVKDVLTTGQILFLSQGRPVFAGVADALSDIAALLSIGVGGVTVYKHGLSVLSVLAAGAMGAGSIGGTLVGSLLSHRIDLSLRQGGIL